MQFSVATIERWKDKSGEPQEHTEWFAVKTFGRRAEIVGEYLHKGSSVYVEGRKRTESWTTSKPAASIIVTLFMPIWWNFSIPAQTGTEPIANRRRFHKDPTCRM